jgi:HAMP domain-containing protein
LVQLSDGQVLHIHLPSPALKASFLPRFGFVWSMVVVAIAVALATYPIIRRLTRRLESLRAGVEQWGTGALSTRVDAKGEDEIGFLAQRALTTPQVKSRPWCWPINLYWPMLPMS